MYSKKHIGIYTYTCSHIVSSGNGSTNQLTVSGFDHSMRLYRWGSICHGYYAIDRAKNEGEITIWERVHVVLYKQQASSVFTLVSPDPFLLSFSHLPLTFHIFLSFSFYFLREIWQATPRKFAQSAVLISINKIITHGAHYTSKRELCYLSMCVVLLGRHTHAKWHAKLRRESLNQHYFHHHHSGYRISSTSLMMHLFCIHHHWRSSILCLLLYTTIMLHHCTFLFNQHSWSQLVVCTPWQPFHWHLYLYPSSLCIDTLKCWIMLSYLLIRAIIEGESGMLLSWKHKGGHWNQGMPHKVLHNPSPWPFGGLLQPCLLQQLIPQTEWALVPLTRE